MLNLFQHQFHQTKIQNENSFINRLFVFFLAQFDGKPDEADDKMKQYDASDKIYEEIRIISHL